jgi:hypothetical protein
MFLSLYFFGSLEKGCLVALKKAVCLIIDMESVVGDDFTAALNHAIRDVVEVLSAEMFP